MAIPGGTYIAQFEAGLHLLCIFYRHVLCVSQCCIQLYVHNLNVRKMCIVTLMHNM